MNFKALNSNWIWRDNSTDPNQYVTFKQVFNLTDTNAKLYICCDTNYAAYLNGVLVGFGQYLAYPENKYYDILELKDAAGMGENTLTIDVYYQGISTSCYAQGKPGLIYTIYSNGRYIPNTDVTCRKMQGFKEGIVPMITSQLGPAFEYDASEIQEFSTEATVLDFGPELPISLRKRPVKKLITEEYTKLNVCRSGIFSINTDSPSPADRIYTALSAPLENAAIYSKGEVTICKNNTYVIIDLEGETAGYFTLELNSDEGVRIDIGFGEHIIDGRVRTKIDERNFAFTYYTKNGENKFTNYFRRIGGKYLQLNFSNVSSPVILKYAGLLKAEYPVKEAPMPNLTDSLDRRIYSAAVKTLKCCMHEHYEDTPWREQSLYALDSRNQSLFGYWAFLDNTPFVKASIELLGSSLKADGFLDLTAPSSGKKTIPSFTMAWLVWVAEYAEYTKDKSFLMQQENKISKIINNFEKQLKNGILPLPINERIWNFYDWAPGLDNVKDKETDAIYNLYFCLALSKLICVEKHFRGRELTVKIRKLYKKVKKAVNKTFYDANEQIYCTFTDDSAHKHKLTQALALCSGVAKKKRKLRQRLVYDNTLYDLTLSTKQFEYEALSADLRTYGDYILKNIRKIWGKMILEGADTFYETAKGAADFDNAGSLCHGWSAAPVYWYHILFGKNYFKSK